MSVTNGNWQGGKPIGSVSRNGNGFRLSMIGVDGPVNMQFNMKAYGNDLHAARRAAEDERFRRALEAGRLRNRWRHVTDTQAGEKFIEVQLTQSCIMKVDVADLPLVEAHTWYADPRPTRTKLCYARAWFRHPDGKRRKERFHNMVQPSPHEVDHRNGNGLDNRRSNLRAVTRAENRKNRTLAPSNKTGVNGVSERRGSFLVQWPIDGHNHGKWFSTLVLGREEAWRQAVEFRREIDRRDGYMIRYHGMQHDGQGGFPPVPPMKQPHPAPTDTQ